MDPGTFTAILETSGTAGSLIVKYYRGVKDAKEEVESLQTEIDDFKKVLLGIQGSVQSSDPAKLSHFSSLATAIEGSSSEIEKINHLLDPSKGKRLMRRVGIRALKWPFTKKEVQEHIERLERLKSTLSLASNSCYNSCTQENQKAADQDRQLAKLLVANGATFDSFDQQHRPECVQNTRVDLIRQVHEWSTSDDKYIFWLNGMAGTGKSTIARTVARMFADQNRLGASFFFSRGAGDLGDATKFVSTIAYQLAHQSPLVSPFLKEYISQAIANHDNVARQGLRNQWKKLILEPLSLLTERNLSPILVIDALDECEHEDDIKLILQLFTELQDRITVKPRIFLTSRPEITIRLGFRNMHEILHQDLVLHDIPRLFVERDICVFLRHELSRIRDAHSLLGDWPGEKVINLLVEKSDCLFIYIATVCRFIEDPSWRPQERLSLILESDATGTQLTAELDGMYMQILKHSIIRASGKKDISRLSERFRQIIGSIVTSFDVLSPTALAGLLYVSMEDVNLTLEAMLVPNELSALSATVYDAKRLVLINRSVIEEAPLQLYCSALVFCPSQSMIKKMSRSELPDWITRCPTVEDDWSSLSQVLEGHTDAVNAAAFSSNYQILASGSSDWTIRLWHPATGTLRSTLEGHRYGVSSVAFSENGQLLASGSWDQTVRLWNPATGKLLRACEGHTAGVTAVAFSGNGQLLASASNDTTIRLWDPATGALQSILAGHKEQVTAVAVSDNSQLLASGSMDFTVRLWDFATGIPRRTLEGHTCAVNAVAFADNGQLLASGSSDKTIRLWNPATGKLLRTCEGHTNRVTAVAFSGDGQLLASGSSDLTIRLWDPATASLRAILESHTNGVKDVSFSCNSQLLASVSEDETIRLWDPALRTSKNTLDRHSHVINALAISGDGQILASASCDQTIRLWDPATGALQSTLKGHTDAVFLIAFSGDGQFLASGSNDLTVRVWELATKTLRATLEGHDGFVSTVVFSEGRQLLASGSTDNTVRLWDLEAGTLQSTLKGHSGSIIEVVFSEDGRFLASASSDQTVRLWDTTTGQLQNVFKGHESTVTMVAFSGNGKLLASASRDQTIRLWDPASGNIIRRLDAEGVHQLSFSSDGTRLETNLGHIQLSNGANCNSGVWTMQRNWLTWNGHKALWLPPDFRISPGFLPRCLAVRGNLIAMGYQSGRVISLEVQPGFIPSGPEDL
ncbi:hypothetical protein MMC07_006623 [Pseudocyphellaria aurata]|nr:hypothetical protein [Pseudocyphellaria aurata]